MSVDKIVDVVCVVAVVAVASVVVIVVVLVADVVAIIVGGAVFGVGISVSRLTWVPSNSAQHSHGATVSVCYGRQPPSARVSVTISPNQRQTYAPNFSR
jgi:hypothetical protein